MISDFELEQKFIAALINSPEELHNIESFFDESDLAVGDDADTRHRTIFTIIKQAVQKNESINPTIVCQRLKALNISSDADDMPIEKYAHALSLRKTKEGSVLPIARELKKLAARRNFCEAGEEIIQRMNEISPSSSYVEIIEEADRVFNKRVNHFELEGDVPVNIYDEMEAIIEDRGNNPVSDFGMLGPFPTVNKIYGSLVREGNVAVIVARAKVGKSQLAMRYATYVADRYDVDILHLDNGEMSKEELIFRQCAALSGVPLYLIETGKWRNAGPEIVAKIRSVWPRVKKLRFYYFCVGGMSADEMISLTKKFYYNTVGRGKRMIISFDYLKPPGLPNGNVTEWQIIGEIINKFKKLLAKDILFEGNPMISMFTSVQSNRAGITTNKKADNITDDESVVSLSDRIIQYCSHMFLLRRKTMDEMQDEGEDFGTHKLICLAARHLGEDVHGHLEPVKVGDKLKQNFVNLEFKNFQIEEKGDLRDIVQAKSVDTDLKSDELSDTPDF